MTKTEIIATAEQTGMKIARDEITGEIWGFTLEAPATVPELDSIIDFISAANADQLIACGVYALRFHRADGSTRYMISI